jgi:predicted MFS family arabinose efflux permease
MSTEALAPEEKPPSRLFLPSLVLAIFSVGTAGGIVTQLSVDIATTYFGSANATSVAAVSQLSTVSNAAQVVLALVLSILAIRFRRKPLLLAGLLLVVVSAVGSFLAPTLDFLLVFYALEGIGSVMVGVMAITLIGDSLPLKQKPKAISYITAVGALATVAGIFLVGYIADVAGWRFTFAYLMLPLSVAGLVLASFVLPSKPLEKAATSQENPYIRSFKQVFTNKSATACLIANLLTNAGTQVAIFAIAFYQIQFAMPKGWRVGIMETAAIIFIVAPLIAGRLVNKFGAKRLTIVSTLLSAFFCMTFFFIPNFWVSLAFDMLHVWFAATASVAFACLILDQVPKSRGTVMSMNRVFNSIGETIAPAVGGGLLALTGGVYGAIGLALGSLTIAGIVILFFFARDPTREIAAQPL